MCSSDLLVAPSTLLPDDCSHWPVEVRNDLDSTLGDVDVLYMLRLQSERMAQGLIPHLGEYATRFGLTPRCVAALRDGARIMHPGPMNRGVEMHVDPSELAQSLIHRQVANGVSVRMAVLFSALNASGESTSVLKEVAS